jgi:restriction system protein
VAEQGRQTGLADTVLGDGPTVWVVRAGQGGRHAADFEAQDLVAIGFAEFPSVGNLSREEITALAAAELGPKAAGAAAGQLLRFSQEIEVGDLVVTPDGGTRELVFLEVTGPYEHRAAPPIPGYPHVRSAVARGRRSRDALPKRVLYSLGALLTVFRPAGQAELRALLAGAPLPESAEEQAEGEETAETASDLYSDLQARAAELISAAIAHLDAYETQDLVAGIFRAMGYHAQVATPGADRGTDIVASRDPLAVEPPVIRVQVKARPNTRSTPGEIRELAGVLDSGERGVFVSTGGFTREAEADARARRMTLIDAERLQELLVEHYDRLDQDAKSLVPLRRLYFP